jgi:hypothetical protein
MRRIESDPEEQKEIEEALSRAATPMHEQPTEEIDTQEILLRLGQTAEFGESLARPLQAFGHPHLTIRDPAELGWDHTPPDIAA